MKLRVMSVSLALCLLLAGCGASPGAPGMGDADPADEVMDPVNGGTPAPSPEEDDEAVFCLVDDVPDGRDAASGEDPAEVPPQDDSAVEGEGPGPDDWAESVPTLSELCAMTDAEATLALGHRDPAVLLAAWGEPDITGPECCLDVPDIWNGGTGSIRICYDPHDGNVSEVTIIPSLRRLEPGLAERAAALPADGAADFLAELLEAGATRFTVRAVLGSPVGCVASTGTVYAGDVYLLKLPDGFVRYITVYYDQPGNIVTVPRDASFLDRWEATDDPPVCEEPYVFLKGVHDSQWISCPVPDEAAE